MNAWMIRNDGTAFPVSVHLYGAADDVEETLYAAEWLYGHTRDGMTKKHCIELMAAYAYEQDPDLTGSEIASTLLYISKHFGAQILSDSFIEAHVKDFEKYINEQLATFNLENLNDIVNKELNQEFLRARFGGMYDSDDLAGGEVYYRISSVGFNWFNIIWEHAYAFRKRAKFITVVKDPESTGYENTYLKLNGEPIKHMPIDEFITVAGRPVLDNKPDYIRPEFLDPTMSIQRRKSVIAHIQDEEIKAKYVILPVCKSSKT